MKLGLLVFASLILAFAHAFAQKNTEIQILRVDTDNWSKIRVYFRAYCNGEQTDDFTNVTVTEGDSIYRPKITCPPSTEPISVGLVLDCTGSVAGTSFYNIQTGAGRFVSLFQLHTNGYDEGAIISFSNSEDTLNQSMTERKDLLYNAIDSLYPSGATRLFDAVIRALWEVSLNAHNKIKAVLVLSDGGDNASDASLGDVLQLAHQLKIPIYTIGLNYHDTLNDLANMKAMADSSGGKYIELTRPDDIIAAYLAMLSLVTNGANDCTMEYIANCPDGTERTVTVTADVCGLHVSATAKYTAPYLSGIPALDLKFGSATSYAGGDIYVPVIVTALPADATIKNLTFNVTDTPEFPLLELLTSKYFAKYFTVTKTAHLDSTTISLSGYRTLHGQDTLMILRYKAPLVDADSSFDFPPYLARKTTVECLRLESETNRIFIKTRPYVEAICGDSIFIAWDKNSGTYSSDTLTVRVQVLSTGTTIAQNTRIRIHVPYGIQLVSPVDEYVLPYGLTKNTQVPIEFQVRIVPNDSARSFHICFDVIADSSFKSTCCKTIGVEQGHPALHAWCVIPYDVRWNDSLQSYQPPTFPVFLYLENRSTVTASNVQASIEVPNGFAIDSLTPAVMHTTPQSIKNQDTGMVIWNITPLDRPNSDSVLFCVRATAGGDSVICCRRVFIEASPIRAALDCSNLVFLKYDEDAQTYDPPLFIVSTMVKNKCSLPMTGARGTIRLPSFMKLNTGESLWKDLPNGAVVSPGDSNKVSWLLQAVGAPNTNETLCIEITAANYPGAKCCIPFGIEMKSGIPTLTCSMTGPDTIHFVNGAYQPNPFKLNLTVKNTGTSAAKKLYAALLQGADLSIDSTDSALKLVTDSLAAGDNAGTSFKIRTLNRTKGRYDTIRVSVYAQNGGAVVCEKIVYIEPIRGPQLELTCSGPDSLVFSDSLNSYLPSPFTIGLNAKNTGTAPADSIVAEFLPPPNMVLINGEQAAKLLQPSSLNVGESGAASWQANAIARSIGRVDTIHAQVRVKGVLLKPIEPCPVMVYIPAARTVQLSAACDALSDIKVIGNKYSPDPFSVRLRVFNFGDARAFDVTASLLSHARLQLVAGDSITKTRPILASTNGQTEFLWQFSPVASPTGDTVEVCFRISARFQNEITCCTKIFVPPLGTGSITTGCNSVDTVRYDAVKHAYPNPILIHASATNPTQNLVDSVNATILLPNGLQLSSGETPDRLLQNLASQETRQLQWRVDVLQDTSTVAKSRRVRIQFYANGVIQTCDLTIVVLPAPLDTTSIMTLCSTVDTVRWDKARASYPNPILVKSTITNPTSATVDSVNATIQLPNGMQLSNGETAGRVERTILPQQIRQLQWNVDVIADTSTVAKVKTIHIQYVSGGKILGCDMRVIILPVPPDTASMTIACSAPDTIHYINAQIGLQPSPFTVKTDIRNNGSTALTGIRATLTLPAGVTLANGENATKALTGDLQSHSTASITWACVPSQTMQTIRVSFTIDVNAGGLSEQKCTLYTVIERTHQDVLLQITRNNLGKAGDIVSVPMLFTNYNQAVIRDFGIDVAYDASVVEYMDLTVSGSLTEGWQFTEKGIVTPGTLRYHASSNVPLADQGTLLWMKYRITSGDGTPDRFAIKQTDLHLESPVFPEGVSAILQDGAIVTSGDCILPLKAAATYALKQNKPNPFNPATVIEYTISADAGETYITLEVFDTYGRFVSRLDEGSKSAGTYTVRFDARSLASGMYYYRLQANGHALLRKMIVAK